MGCIYLRKPLGESSVPGISAFFIGKFRCDCDSLQEVRSFGHHHRIPDSEFELETSDAFLFGACIIFYYSLGGGMVRDVFAFGPMHVFHV